jgi:DsbC/DsbD-like thiol-disulfide interchange protein
VRPIPALLTTLLLTPAALHGAASPWVENGPSRLRLITPWTVAPTAGELRLGVQFHTEPGWHVYWKNSGDAGYAPTVKVAAAPGLTPPELLYPAPRRFELPGDLVAFGYEGEVVYPLPARLTGLAGATATLTAEVDYLVCEVDCIPFRSTLTLAQPLGEPAPDPQTGPALDTWWDRLPRTLAASPGVSAETLLDSASPGAPMLEVRLRGVAADPATADLFLESHELVDAERPVARALPDGIAFRVPLTVRQAGKSPGPGTPFAWTATGLALAGAGDGSRTVSLEARQAAVPLAAAEAPAGSDAGRPTARAGTPAKVAALAALSWLAALALWGLLPGLPRRAASPARPRRLEALGFAAAGGAVALLYLLSRRVSPEGLAAIQLCLLGAGLLAWLSRRQTAGRRRPVAGALLAAGLLACLLAAPWLAERNRLPAPDAPSGIATTR